VRIIRIKIENFRSFKEEIELNELKKINSIVGSNSTGKSNILEILSFLRGMAKNQWSKNFLELTFDRNGHTISLEIDFELDDEERQTLINVIPTAPHLQDLNLDRHDLFRVARYQATIDSNRCNVEDLRVIAKEQFVHVVHYQHNPNGNVVSRSFAPVGDHFHNSGTIQDFLKLQPSGINNQNSNLLGIFEPHKDRIRVFDGKLISMISEFLSEISIYGAHRKANENFTGPEKRRLFESGENLQEVMSTILGDDRRRFDDIMKQYGDILGYDLNVNVPWADSNDYHTVKIGEEGLQTETDFPNMSTGLHEVLILILAVFQAKKNEVICIEEPEIHLHASAQKRLFQFIVNQSENIQFFITTHSPIFTSVNEKINTFLVTKSKGNSSVIKIENESELKFIRQQLGIRNSDAFGTDNVIFVEGDTEEIAIPLLAEKFGITDIGIDIGKANRLVNLKGNGIIPKLQQFLEYLKDSDVHAFLIADGDKSVAKSIEDFVRRGLIQEGDYKIWEKEFEDTFPSSMLVKAMSDLATKNDFIFTLSESDLENQRDSKKVADILQKHLHDNTQPDLNKPELAKQLAENILEEIESNNGTRNETHIEKLLETLKIKLN